MISRSNVRGPSLRVELGPSIRSSAQWRNSRLQSLTRTLRKRRRSMAKEFRLHGDDDAASDRNTLLAVILRRRWKQLRATSGEPIDCEADPFVDGSIGSPQPVPDGRKRMHRILGTTRAPTDC